MNAPPGPVARALLAFPALLYGTAVRLRNRFYDRPGATWRGPVPVISVGNLTLGGTGKTPLVAWLAGRLRDLGHRPAVVSRGYGGRAGKGPLVVSHGEGPRCGAAVCGDEPFELARRVHGVRIVVGSDRRAGVRAAAATGSDVVVLDDGFQHRRLERDLDVVLLEATNPFDGGRLLPAGRLREPPAALARADVVVLTRSGPKDRTDEETERTVRLHNERVPILHAGHRPVGYVDADGRPADRPRRALAFCGIGSPAVFLRDLEVDGVFVAGRRLFRDHHRYSATQLERLRSAARELGADLVTTEKDLSRIAGAPMGAEEPRLLALRIEAVVHETDRLLGLVRRVLESPRR